MRFWQFSRRAPLRPEIGTKIRQPAFLAPRAVVLLIALLFAVHLLRSILAPGFDRFIIVMLGVLPIRYLAGAEGVILVLPGGPVLASLPFVSHAFLHANFMHLALNAAWLLAFGSAVARRTGTRKFLLLYVICAIAGAVAHVLVNPGSQIPMIGASGAISGMMGASFRVAMPTVLGSSHHTEITPLSDRRLLTICGIWIATNLVFGLSGLRVGEQVLLIAWDAHIGGFLAGLLLAGLFARRWRGHAGS